MFKKIHKFFRNFYDFMNELRHDPKGSAGLLLALSLLAIVFFSFVMLVISIPMSIYGVYVSYLWAVCGVKPTLFGFFAIFFMFLFILGTVKK